MPPVAITVTSDHGNFLAKRGISGVVPFSARRFFRFHFFRESSVDFMIKVLEKE